jgi:hypothetical protein
MAIEQSANNPPIEHAGKCLVVRLRLKLRHDRVPLDMAF